MLTNEQLIAAVNNLAGVWVKAEESSPAGFYLAKYGGNFGMLEIGNHGFSFKNETEEFKYSRFYLSAWKLYYLQPLPDLKASILAILEERKVEEVSDEKAFREWFKSFIPKSSMQWEIWKAARQSLRPTITALQEELKEKEDCIDKHIDTMDERQAKILELQKENKALKEEKEKKENLLDEIKNGYLQKQSWINEAADCLKKCQDALSLLQMKALPNSELSITDLYHWTANPASWCDELLTRYNEQKQ